MTGIVPSPEFETSRPRVALDGVWAFSYDPEDIGVRERWFANDAVLPEETVVPGCSQVRKYDSAQGNVRVTDVAIPEHSSTIMLKYGCLHPSWYQRRFTVPAEWTGQRVFLHVGGVKPAAELWLNGEKLGETVTSRSPVRCELTPHIRFGEENVLTARIHWPKYRLDGVWDVWHAWSGLYRSLWVEAVSPAHLADIHVIPAIEPAAARLEIAVDGGGDGLRAVCKIEGEAYAGETAVRGGGASVAVPMPGAKLWSVNAPNLYQATVKLYQGDALLDEGAVRFGLREIAVKGRRVLLNGTPIFLHGGCDDHVYPETVCPPADVNVYRERIRKAKQYGFNYTKSACEVFTREYLDAADELGYLVCQEMPFGMLGELRDIRNDPPAELTDLWQRELANIVTFDRSHPSVIAYSMTSEQLVEVENPAPFTWFSRKLPAVVRRLNPGALVFDVTAAFHFSTETRHGRRDIDLMEDWLGTRQFTLTPLHGPLQIPDTVTLPFLLHEWNWVSALPDPALIERYRDLPLEPVQVPEMVEAARANGVLEALPEMVDRSYQLKHVLRKDAYELAFEQPKVAGFHGWLIHDIVYCPEGVFNEFWEEPAGLSAEEFRTYNDDTVLTLDDGDRRSFTHGAMPLGVRVVHFGERPLDAPVLRWQLKLQHEILAEGERMLKPIACGARVDAGRLTLKMPAGPPAAFELACELWDGTRKVCWNHWPLWRFSAEGGRFSAVSSSLPLPAGFQIGNKPDDPLAPAAGTRVFVTHRLTDAGGGVIDNLLTFIREGGRVLLLSSGTLKEAESCLYRTVPFNTGTHGNMGTVVHPHPALGDFPHEGWCDLPFIPLIEGAYPMRLDPFRPARIDPIIRSNGHLVSMEDKAYLFEVGLGDGVLLACSLNLLPAAHTDPAARHLLRCLLAYLADGNPAPEVTITEEQLRAAIR
ncbi:MAG: sugar-binding domain-containing protein [Armatimonadota bacterium]